MSLATKDKKGEPAPLRDYNVLADDLVHEAVRSRFFGGLTAEDRNVWELAIKGAEESAHIPSINPSSKEETIPFTVPFSHKGWQYTLIVGKTIKDRTKIMPTFEIYGNDGKGGSVALYSMSKEKKGLIEEYVSFSDKSWKEMDGATHEKHLALVREAIKSCFGLDP